MIEGRYEGKLAEDDDYVYGGDCTLVLAGGEFVLTLSRHTIYQIQDSEIYVGTAIESGEGIVLEAREQRFIQSETTDRERIETCNRRFTVHATPDHLELVEPEHLLLRPRQLAPGQLAVLVLELARRFPAERLRAANDLEALGRDAIPLLIEGLEDQRSFEALGQDIGAPAGAAPKSVRRTVGQECRRMLARILTPAYSSPHEPKLVRKPRGPFFEVHNWRAWWCLNRDRSLAELRQDVLAAVDRYWLAGEQTQVLDEGSIAKLAALVGDDDEEIARYAEEAIEYAVYRLAVDEPGHVPTYALHLTQIPVGTRRVSDLNELAMSFHAYTVLGGNKAVLVFGNAARRRFRKTGKTPETATGTRTALFMECRRRVHTASDMTEEDWRYSDALLSALRAALVRRIEGQQAGYIMPSIADGALRAALARHAAPAEGESPPAAGFAEAFPLPPGAIARFGPPPLWLRRGASGLAFAPDGSRLVAASWDAGIVVFEPQTGAAVARFGWPTDPEAWDEPESVAYAPDGRLIAAASTRRVVLYEADTGARIRTLMGRAPVSFIGRRTLLFRRPYDTDLPRFVFADAETGETRGALPPGVGPRYVSHFAGSTDGRFLAFDEYSCSGATVLDCRSGRALARIAEPDPPGVKLSVVAIAISPDGGLACSKRNGDEPFRLWRVPRSALQRLAARLRLLGAPWTPPEWTGPRLLDFGPPPVFSTDGSLLAVADGRHVSVYDRDRDRVRFLVPARPPNSLAFSPDGATLAVGENTGKIRILDALSGADRLPPDDAGTRVTALSFSSDGNIIVASAGGRERAFDVRTRAEVPVSGRAPLESDDRNEARSPSGQLVARGVWEAVEVRRVGPAEPAPAVEGEPLLRLPIGEHSMVTALAFSPDGRLLAAGTNAGGRIRLFQMPHGEHHSDLPGHAGFATALAFSPDSRLLASAGDDACIYLWAVS